MVEGKHKGLIMTERILFMTIGSSGCGKSTYIKKLKNNFPEIRVYSWDDLRMEWYLSEEERDINAAYSYRLAFERQCKDKQFNQRAQRHFIDMVKVKDNHHIVVDNTNLSQKRRRFFIDEARRHGYMVIALLFPVTMQLILDRQSTRKDKVVPTDVVKRQYMSIQLPSYGEFDEVHVV